MRQTVREPLSRGYTLALTVSFAGAGRLHLLDPADRVRRVPRGPLHRAGVRGDRGADGARLLAQLARRRALRAAAGRPRRGARRSRWSPPSTPRSRSAGTKRCRCFVVLQGLTMAASPSPRRTSARWRWSIWRRSPAPPRRSRASSARSARRSSASPSARHSTAPCDAVRGRHARPAPSPASSSSSLTEPKRLFAPIRIDSRSGDPTASRGPRLTATRAADGARALRPPLGSRYSATLAVVVGSGADHQRLADFLGAAADRIFDPLRDVGIFLEIDLGVLAALADADAVIAEPGARFLDQPGLDAEVEDLADLGRRPRRT